MKMKPRKFLKVAVLLMLFPSIICIFLPDTIASGYTKVMLPLVPLISLIFSLRIAMIYQKWLKRAFIFLFLFLLFISLTHIDLLWELLMQRTGYLFPLFVISAQWATYAMLIIFSICILKVTEVRRIGIKGWLFMIAIFLLGITVVIYRMDVYPPLLLFIRLLDVLIVIMLMPVVLLYAEQMRLEGRESITFTTIVSGIIMTIIVTYIYEIVSGASLYEMREIYHTGSPLDALYLFSYLIIATALYVHSKYDEWGFRAIEKALEFELK